jgi:hypothetical protein
VIHVAVVTKRLIGLPLLLSFYEGVGVGVFVYRLHSPGFYPRHQKNISGQLHSLAALPPVPFRKREATMKVIRAVYSHITL